MCKSVERSIFWTHFIVNVQHFHFLEYHKGIYTKYIQQKSMVKFPIKIFALLPVKNLSQNIKSIKKMDIRRVVLGCNK